MGLSNNGTDKSFGAEPTVASIILSLACLFGVLGNALVIWIILFAMRTQRSPTVVLILNLAITDVLVLITLPVWIYDLVHGWVFGDSLCKILSCVISCNMYASIFLITAMSVERFMAIIYPFATQRWRRSKVFVKLVLAIWILAFLFTVPVLIYQAVDNDDDTGQHQCLYGKFDTDQQKILCTVLQIVVGFLIPFSVLSICYFCIGRKVKQLSFNTPNRAGAVISSVLIVFFICWAPHHVLNLISIIALMSKTSDQTLSDTLTDIYNRGIYIAGTLAFINSCINPVLYAFAARNIRNGFRVSALAKFFDQMTHSVKEESRKGCTDTTKKDTSATMEEMHSLQVI
ncbi:C3a anaphylatoxin chemotactic receptor-like [Carcharodon carcharias]|uniref:C3a anaphylatoxin chemotactic receptor-like n=1 Tax=Carcharodon carcharias TaxID=13397 RepID=UPI001B7D9EE2|nr:C3a anaphylatoxin chemotactic receptor-like [Carcharodon carcharias]